MKTLKKISAVILTAASVLTLTGCSASAESTASNTASGEAVKIGVPSDATNQARAINLLADAGLIEVDKDAGYTPELKDVTKYIYNIEIVPAAANTLASTLDDYGASCINGTYAVPAGLSPTEDGLITEKQETGSDNPYINAIVARTEDKDNKDYKTVVKAFQSQLVAEYLLEKNKGSSVPAFDYDKDYTVDDDFVSEIEGYSSSKDGKKEIKVGICGSGDEWKAVQKVLDEEDSGLYIDLVIFDAYNLPNEALNSGEIDLNSFQHKAYLASEIKSQGYKLTAIGDTSSAPLTLYSKKASTLDELKKLAGKK
jgi:ABC-type metal ion transport system substrate-binding protein